MNLTELISKIILENTSSLLKVSNLKLNKNLSEETVKEIFSKEIASITESYDEQDEADWKSIVESLEKENSFDSIFSDIRTVLESVEGINEDNTDKAVDLISMGISLAADNIYKGFDAKVEESAKELEKDLEEKISAVYEDATKDWASKKEKELKESLVHSEDQINTLKEAGKFVISLEKLFTESGLSFDDSITAKVEESKDEIKSLKEENADLKKEQGLRVKDDIFETVMEGLTDLDKEKLKSISESIVFIDSESYKEKLEEMKKTFTSKKGEDEKDDNEDEKDESPSKDKDDLDKKGDKSKLAEEVSRLFGANKLN